MRAWWVPILSFIALLLAADLAGQNPAPKDPPVLSTVLSIEPSRLEFQPQPVGTASAPLSTILSNTGDTALKIVDITASGIDFNQTNSCGEAILPRSKCEVQVVFKPATTGSRLGVLSVMISNPGIPYYVGLSGVGE